ncbi:ABC transporter ATP-binding protein [Verticiella sediminum]|uniref:ABC transporter ATP-binding protein n=1 Tax=Verticiella sediminum TaxID=1247510 RepID=A0A556AIP4_9BURK|nr:ABC transporter ATP-binding protein [Verticiella sediminum]TSH92772.1 ABC transporter ATP-binding protein [Verticiella sediminum]
MPEPLLSVRELCVSFGARRVLDHVSLDVRAGEVLGLIGESGSGKSMTALAIIGLLPATAQATGSVRHAGTELMRLDERGWCEIRGRGIGMVFQDPMTSLNPVMTLGAQIVETMKRRDGESGSYRRRRAAALLEEVGLPEPERMLGRRPFELSGGQQQRAMIAMMLAAEPKVLIADEPTTALDVTTQAQVLRLLLDVQRRRGMAMLFISHDLDAVLAMADRVAVMRGGRLLEQGPVGTVLDTPAHDYTRQLLDAYARLPARRTPAAPASTSPAIALEDVSVNYGAATVLRGVSLTLAPGRTLGVAGESGSGKTTLARAMLGLVRPSRGRLRVCGQDPHAPTSRAQFARLCQYVFQDTSGSLNPRRTLEQTLGEALEMRAAGARETAAHVREHGAHLMTQVGLDPALLMRYPHQLSGGQRQRIVIARALAMQPQVLICDEPVSALDATVRNQVLDLLVRLRDEHALTLVFIGHDLAVMESLVDEVLVLRRGEVEEYGASQAVFDAPRSAYARELLDAARLGRRRHGVAGMTEVPEAARTGTTCAAALAA